MSEALLGDPDDLRRILEAVDARNELLDAQLKTQERLAAGVEALTGKVGALRTEIDQRPTAASQAHKRRQVVASLIVYGLLIIWGHDAHVEHCGPGSRAEAVIKRVADPTVPPNDAAPPELTLDQIKQIVEDEQPSFVCDATFPFHAHETGGFPGPAALLGFALYGAGGTALWLWTRGPRHGRRTTDAEETL